LYAVLITCLGCRNLSRISRLTMTSLYRRRTAAENSELAAGDPRDRAAARWYGWVQIGGGVLAAFYFVVFFAPATVYTVRWMVSGLAESSPATLRFWVMVVSGCFALAPVIIALACYLREHRKRAARRAT
jgi:putative peptide zinc metalloprotease protein